VPMSLLQVEATVSQKRRDPDGMPSPGDRARKSFRASALPSPELLGVRAIRNATMMARHLRGDRGLNDLAQRKTPNCI